MKKSIGLLFISILSAQLFALGATAWAEPGSAPVDLPDPSAVANSQAAGEAAAVIEVDNEGKVKPPGHGRHGPNASPEASPGASPAAEAEKNLDMKTDTALGYYSGHVGLGVATSSSNFIPNGMKEGISGKVGEFLDGGHISAGVLVNPFSSNPQGLTQSGVTVDANGNPVSNSAANNNAAGLVANVDMMNLSPSSLRYCSDKHPTFCVGPAFNGYAEVDSNSDGYALGTATLRAMKMLQDGKYFVGVGVGLGGATGGASGGPINGEADIFGWAADIGAGVNLKDNGATITAEVYGVRDLGDLSDYNQHMFGAALAARYELPVGELDLSARGEDYTPFGIQTDSNQKAFRADLDWSYTFAKPKPSTAANAQ